MAKVERFEDPEVWQEAREIVKFVYSVTGRSETKDDHALCDQMWKAAVSMMANIAEGFARILFLAKAFGAELQSHLYVALDAGSHHPGRV